MKKHLDWSIKNSIHVIIIIFSIFSVFTILYALNPEVFNFWNNKLNDSIFNFKFTIGQNPEINPLIAHIDISDTSIAKHKISAFDRTIYADAVETLSKIENTRVVFDINFQESHQNTVDKSYVNNVKKHGKVYIPVIPQSTEFSLMSDTLLTDNQSEEIIQSQLWHPVIKNKGNPIYSHRIITNFNELQQASTGIGHIAVEADDDGIYRRIPLFIKYKDGFIPFISLNAICDYYSVDDTDIEVHFGKYIILKNPQDQFGTLEDIRIPIDHRGNMIINYAGRWSDSFYHYSIENFIKSNKNLEETLTDLQNELKDSIVIISDVTTRGKDYGSIPIEKVYPLSGIHSNFLNSVLQQDFLKPITFNRYIINMIIIIILLSLLGIKFKTIPFTVFSSILFALLQAYFMFKFIFFNVQSEIIITDLSYVITFFSIIIYKYIAEEKSNLNYIKMLHEAASNFVPSEFLNFLERMNLLEVRLGDQIQTEMTVLFSDIRSFTSISEQMEPEENFAFINSYLNKMGPVIRENKGFIDKYIGDAIMALFPYNPENCVKSGISMMNRLAEFNSERKARDEIEINIGIGIHTGDLMLGIIGEDKRYEGTVIADAVNLASRLEGLTKYYGASIIISEHVLDRIEDKSAYHIRFLDLVKVKGKKDAIAIYEVIIDDDKNVNKHKIETIKMFENAFFLYKNKKFKEALEGFNTICDMNPDDLAAKLFVKRSEHYLQNGVSEDWQGVEEHLSK